MGVCGLAGVWTSWDGCVWTSWGGVCGLAGVGVLTS